jgi:serine/threonine protein kinase
LVDDAGHIRLCDFGLSGFAEASAPNSITGGVADYTPPEKISLTEDSPPQLAAGDIFAFASLCIQARYIQ